LVRADEDLVKVDISSEEDEEVEKNGT